MTVSMPLLYKPVDQKTGLWNMFIFEKKNLAFFQILIHIQIF